MSWGHQRWVGTPRARFGVLASVVAAVAVLVPLVAVSASADGVAACTMVGKGVFVAGGNQIFKEDSLSTDLSQKQNLVLRSVTGPTKAFHLSTLTAAACRNNTSFPPEEGSSPPVNVFAGAGTGSFGTSRPLHPGFTIRFELGDYGDSAGGDNATADLVAFQVKDSHGTIVWSGRGHLTSGSQEISQTGGGPPPPPPPGSCEPSSSLSVLVTGTNVVSYVPKGNWGGGPTGIAAVNVEGSSITPTVISTRNVVNSAASNPTTGKTVATSNGTDVYILSGTSLSNTLTDGGTGSVFFSGGSPTTAGVAMDAPHNRAVLGLSTSSGPGFQFLDLSSNTFGTPFASPSGAISEDPLIDPSRNLLLSATENNNYEIVNISNPSSPTFFEHAVTTNGELDSSGEDCTTGIALAPAEFSDPSEVFIADLTQATFTPGSPSGTWTAPSQTQTLSESSLSAGASGIAVAQGTHIGVVAGEFGGNEITAIKLPSTSGSGTPAIQDWVSCGIGNTPDGTSWSEGLDPHTLTAYQTPNGSGDAIGLFANGGASWLARVDLTKLLNPSIVPRDTAGHLCSGGTIPSTAESFVSVP